MTATDNRSAEAMQERLVIPERTPEPEARAMLFQQRTACDQCGMPIAALEECTAVLFCGHGLWKLCHTLPCVAAAILTPWNSKGLSASKYLRRFG